MTKQKAAGRRKKDNTSILQLKITLKSIAPPVWRRLQVPGETTLGELHQMIQAAMGWYSAHLHCFTIDGVEYSLPDFELGCEDERRVRLDQVVTGVPSRFRYVYDFGDNWDHDIRVEKSLAPEKGVTYPRCVKGKRACPPEDCGGPWGYAELLEILSNPQDEEYEERMGWLDDEFDPEEFHIDIVNQRLKRYKNIGHLPF